MGTHEPAAANQARNKGVSFTPDQEQAIDVSKRHLDTCVVAGPGSGKTTVLVEYFKRLVEAGVDPLRILAITFTEKAAANMRAKLVEALSGDPERRGKLERAWVSTVHGFCTRLLRENAVFAGVDPEFAVADARLSWRMQHEAIAEAMNDLLEEHPAAMEALVRGLSSRDFEVSLLRAYDAMRGAGKRVEDLAAFPAPAGISLEDVARILAELRTQALSTWNYSQKQYFQQVLEQTGRILTARGPLKTLEAVAGFSCNLNSVKRNSRASELLKNMRQQIESAESTLITEHYAADRRTLLDILLRFDRIYRERKRQAGLLDFEDLEEFAVRVLEEHADTRARVRGQFDHILMDEFQDTNGQQARLMQLVRAPDRFYAVGDINQSIFGFRHAEPEQFAQYQQEIAERGRRVELRDNFRSRAGVLSAVETIMVGAEGIVERPLVARREFDVVRDVCVELAHAEDEEGEARWIARRIVELAAEGFEFRDVAVLVRNSEAMGGLASAFEEAGVAFVVNQGKGFYETREVNDLTHLLRVIANPRDEVSLAVVLRSPLVAVSDETLLMLKTIGDNLGAVLMALGPDRESGFESPDFARLLGFRDRLKQWRLRREYVSFDRLLLDAMDSCGYEPETGARGAANIDKFLTQARDASGKMSLDEFVEQLALYRKDDPREADSPPEDSADVVTMMTVHAAKGLEYPVVFVAALHKGVQTNPPIVAFSKETGLGAQWRHPAQGAGTGTDDLFMQALRKEWETREKQEGKRLLYVATTRAEELLVLSYSGKQKNWAATVARCLDEKPNGERDEVVTKIAPDLKPWKLRVVTASEIPPATRTRPAAPHGRSARSRAAAELVAAPVVTEQHDANATVTALVHFARCPRAYFLGDHLGYEGRPRELEEADGALAAAELGTRVHALLSGKPVAEPDEEASRLADVFLQSPLGRRVERATRVEREFDFLMAVEGVVIRGQVDLWFEEAGELVIVDYKTDAVTAAQARERARDYEMQLRIYAAAVERVTGKAPRRALLHFLRPGAAIEVDLSPSLLDSPEQAVRDFIEAQEKMDYPLKEGERCQRCPFYRDLCPAGENRTAAVREPPPPTSSG